jgi:hypothetical protein
MQISLVENVGGREKAHARRRNQGENDLTITPARKDGIPAIDDKAENISRERSARR